jgi:hypothetical protein
MVPLGTARGSCLIAPLGAARGSVLMAPLGAARGCLCAPLGAARGYGSLDPARGSAARLVARAADRPCNRPRKSQCARFRDVGVHPSLTIDAGNFRNATGCASADTKKKRVAPRTVLSTYTKRREAW